MRTAVAGAGKVGVFIAKQLTESGSDVVVIEQSEAVIEELASHYPGVRWHLGDCCEPTALEEADIGSVDVMVAATGDDEDNLVVSLLAKQEFAVPRVVARVNHPDNEWLFNETWGVDISVSAPHLLTSLVQEAVSVGSFIRLLNLDQGNARLVEVTLAEDTPAADVSLAQLAIPRNATIVAVLRDRHLVVPRGDTILHPLDEVLALVTEDSEDELRRILVALD
jgi:trk system potassium uptake protein TrkA